MAGSMASQLAAAMESLAVRKTEATPTVRGADWQLGVVTAVGTGTVEVGDITARRLESYTNPQVDDLIVISRSGTGNWLALGRTTSEDDPAWVSYTPTWTAATSNPSIGNGSRAGRYKLIGKTCHVAIRIVPGSTTTFGSGTYLFGVPFPAADDVVEYQGVARLTAGSTYIGQVNLSAGASSMNATFPSTATPATAANMSPTAPATFAQGHILRMSLTYQIA